MAHFKRNGSIGPIWHLYIFDSSKSRHLSFTKYLPNIYGHKISIFSSIIEQAAPNKSSLLLKNILQNTHTLQLFAMIINTESIYKSC